MDAELIKRIERETGHSVYGPSSLPRVVRCPGSVSLGLTIDRSKEKPSVYANRGTMQHDAAEIAYYNGRDALDALPDLSVVEKGNVHDCMDFLDNILKLHTAPDISIEEQVSLEPWGLPAIYGTADVIVKSNGRLDVIDWKFGSGVQVFAENNEQALAYAAGAAGAGSGDTINGIFVHIVQPPLNHYDTFELTYGELSNFVYDVLEPAYERTLSTDPDFVPGDKQCRFCPAGMICEARHAKNVDNAKRVFEMVDEIEDFSTISKEDLAEVLACAEEYEGYIKSIRTYATQELMAGRTFPGKKLVAGRSLRKFSDEEAAFEYLREVHSIPNDMLYTKKPVSPAQAEKLDRAIKKDPGFREFIIKPEGKPMVVDEDDKRPAVTLASNAAAAFSEE